MGTGTPAQARQLRLPNGLHHTDDAATCRTFASDSDTASGHAPCAVVRPRHTDDVLSLVAWANQHEMGIVPVSSTGRRRRSDTVPARRQTVVADLSGLQRLVHADSRDKIAIIEPGIDFGRIDGLLKPHGLRAYRPLAPRAGKSVLASYLEREPLIAANDHWDVGDPFGGTHLVLGSGRAALTGSAAAEGSLETQLANGHRQMVPVGPTNLDLLRVVQGAQGSLGIMTWAAVYCERIPTLETAWFCSAHTLAPVIDLSRELLRRRLGNTLFIVDRVQLALLLGHDAATFDTLRNRLPAWTLFVGLAAGQERPAEKMAWQQADLHNCAARCGVQAQDSFAPDISASALNTLLRTPQAASFRDRARGAHRELFFMQQLNRADTFVRRVHGALDGSMLGDTPLGVYIQPMTQGVHCHIEFTLPHGPGDAAATPAAEALWQQTARRCAEAGAFFSRPYGRWSEFAFARDAGTRSLLSMTKSLLDPKGVMNPGRLPY